MPAQAPRSLVRSRFNALTRECYEDGAPTSAHVGKEMIENDRWLETQLRRTIFNQGFPIAHPLLLPVSTSWYMPPVMEHFVTPGCQNGKLVITGKIPLSVKITVKIWTNTNARFAVAEGDAEDRFRGGTTYTIFGEGHEATYTEGWTHQEPLTEMLFPLSGGTVEAVQFGFRNQSRDAGFGDLHLLTSQIVRIEDNGGTVVVQDEALAALPAQLNGYSFQVYLPDTDEVLIRGREALACNSDDEFYPARRIWNRRLINGLDQKANVELRIFGPQALEIYSIAALEHVRREVP